MQQGAGAPLEAVDKLETAVRLQGAVQTGAVSRVSTRNMWQVLTAAGDRLRCRVTVVAPAGTWHHLTTFQSTDCMHTAADGCKDRTHLTVASAVLTCSWPRTC
jgi:hypothetical protein